MYFHLGNGKVFSTRKLLFSKFSIVVFRVCRTIGLTIILWLLARAQPLIFEVKKCSKQPFCYFSYFLVVMESKHSSIALCQMGKWKCRRDGVKNKAERAKAETFKKCAKMSEKLSVKSQQLVQTRVRGFCFISLSLSGRLDKGQSVVQPAAMATPAPLTAKRGSQRSVCGRVCI